MLCMHILMEFFDALPLEFNLPWVLVYKLCADLVGHVLLSDQWKTTACRRKCEYWGRYFNIGMKILVWFVIRGADMWREEVKS